MNQQSANITIITLYFKNKSANKTQTERFSQQKLNKILIYTPILLTSVWALIYTQDNTLIYTVYSICNNMTLKCQYKIIICMYYSEILSTNICNINVYTRRVI